MRCFIAIIVFIFSNALFTQDKNVIISTVTSGSEKSNTDNTSVISSVGQVLIGNAESDNQQGAYGILYLYDKNIPPALEVVEEKQISKSEMNIYPNPGKERVTVEISTPITGEIKFVLFDEQGKTVGDLNYFFSSEGLYTFEFDTSNLNSGSYFIKGVKKGYLFEAPFIIRK